MIDFARQAERSPATLAEDPVDETVIGRMEPRKRSFREADRRQASVQFGEKAKAGRAAKG